MRQPEASSRGESRRDVAAGMDGLGEASIRALYWPPIAAWRRRTENAERRHPSGFSVAESEGEQGVSRGDGDVLPAVDRVGHRAAIDLTSQRGLPQQRAGAGVEGVEIA